MPLRRTGLWLLAALAALQALPSAMAQALVTRGTNLSLDVSRTDGRLTMDLLGRIWILPPTGGDATLLVESALPARRPRWSPDGRDIVYQASASGAGQLWLANAASGERRRLGDSAFGDQEPAWHPSGERIVFASERRETGLDLWEIDLATGLEWRLSDHPGDETEPAWSSSGRDLVYIRRHGGEWALMLRRFGQSDVALVTAATPLVGPSFRPDGTLVTYFQEVDGRFQLQLVILSNPPLERRFASGEDYSLAPVSWLDRERLFYAADGHIRTRGFDDWTPGTVAFRASLVPPATRQALDIPNRELPLITPATDRLVIRAGRIFDGLSRDYLEEVDVLVDGGLVAEVVPRQAWDDATVIELDDTTLIPGLIDAYSALPATPPERAGPALLSWGLTTIVSPDGTPDAALWEGEDHPGPRLLPAAGLVPAADSEADGSAFLVMADAAVADPEQLKSLVDARQAQGLPVLVTSWVVGQRVGAGLLLAAEAPSASPQGNRYQDLKIASGPAPVALISGLADIGTPGLSQLYRVRQAARLPGYRSSLRRLASLPNLRGGSTPVIVGSRPNGLPPGLAVHAELRALAAAGLAGDQVLMAAGSNAARVLGLSGQIGEISPGSRADMLLVSGDPLERVADALNIVAVVRNGRFYSLVSLLERAGESVE